MSALSGHRTTLLVLAFVAAVSWTVREINHQRIPRGGTAGWTTSDKDSLYHFRRVERAFDEGLAGTDPYLSYPEGSAIPWPPYYTAVAWAWTAPGAPTETEARRDWITRRVASLPRAFGVATSVTAALLGIALAGPAAGLVAGTSHALSSASLITSRVGNGDHHAFIALLVAAMLGLASRAFRPAALADVRGSARRGAVLGAIAGLALGSWVASLLSVGLVQLSLGWLVIRHARRPIAGLSALGIAFHAAAILALLPAVFASPWTAIEPWSVVNLTWFHPLWLAAGGLVFWPLRGRRSARWRRAYPAFVAAGYVVLGGLLAVLPVGPGAALREGMGWLGRGDVFMSTVNESRGLFGSGPFDPAVILGAGIFVLPFAWLAAAGVALRRGRTEMIPWVIAVPFYLAQAARQVRFADLLAVPLAVVVAWALVAAASSAPLAGARRALAGLGRARAPLAGALLLGLALLAHGDLVRHTWTARYRDARAAGIPVPPADLVARRLAEWIRLRTPEPADYSVLAPWTWGHDIEWFADRPSVATNFGPFVGEEGFRAPARFFLAEDPGRGEAILERHRARYVLVTSWLSNQVSHFVRAADPALRDRYLDPAVPEGGALRAAWYGTLGARLLFDGGVIRADGTTDDPLDFLRMVAASAERDPRYTMRSDPTPMGTVWERVPGAFVEAAGAPGDTLEVALAIRYPAADHRLVWSRWAIAGPDGVARLRVPYATDAPNGDGAALGPARWRFAGDEGARTIPEAAVLGGRALRLRDSQ